MKISSEKRKKNKMYTIGLRLGNEIFVVIELL